MPLLGFAQSYSLNWSFIGGGGGASTGAVFTVRGTIGQAEAGKMTGCANHEPTHRWRATIPHQSFNLNLNKPQKVL